MKLLPLTGFVVTLAVIGVELGGGLRTWERMTVDARFASGLRPSQPMTTDIVHVDIDDGAIDRVGLWPWDRGTIADLIEAIDDAGARTIAIDMLLSEEQRAPAGAPPGEGPDARLARVLGAAHCVLPVIIHERELYDDAWSGREGELALRNLLEVLGRDVQLEPETALEEAGVRDPRRRVRFLLRPLEFKRAATWRALQRSPRPITTFEELEALVAPNKGAHTGSYPEQSTLRAVWRQFEAWRLIRRHLLEGDARGNFRDQAPLPAFAEQAEWVGYVNADAQMHQDGALREIAMRLRGEGGYVLPFGLAAAARYEGLRPIDISVGDDELLFKDRRLPLRDGNMWINWPPSDTDPGWHGLLRQSDTDDATAGHISAWAFVKLAGDRRTHAQSLERLASLTTRVLAERDRRAWLATAGDPLSEINQDDARSECEFFLDLSGDADLRDLQIAAKRWRITENAALGDPEREALLRHVDDCETFLRLQDAGGDGAGARDALAAATIEVLAWRPRPPQSDDDLSETRLAAAAREVEAILEAPGDDAHRQNCELWRALVEAIAEGEQAIAAEHERLRNQVEDRLVFLGFTATGAVADVVQTPLHPTTPGVVVHAAVANMVMTNRPVRFAPSWLTIAITLVLGLLCSLAAVALPTIFATVVAVGLLGAYAGAGGWWLFADRALVLPIVAPLLAGAGSWMACTVLQAATSRRERLQITRQFRARVSGQLVDRLVAQPDALSVSGAEREVTVMFGDLAGFTSISEALGGTLAVSTLNRVMCALVPVLVDDGAYVNKFLGDGVMAFWSAFDVDPQQAAKACRSALNCQRAIEGVNADPEFAKIPRIELRVGIATGRAVVGDCGAPPSLNDYTVIGDTVNLAARLESANKQFGTHVLVNGRTQALLDDPSVLIRPIGRIIVAGQTQPVEVYELLPPETDPELIELTERAVDAFGDARFEEALRHLSELEERFGPSRMIQIYRETIRNVGDVFDGVLHLREK